MTRMMDNYFWPTARAKNFLKKLNERGYTETKPTNYEANIQALASQVNVPPSSLLAMNPIEFGFRAFRPQDVRPFLQELLGPSLYIELSEPYYNELLAIGSLGMLTNMRAAANILISMRQ